VGEFHEGLVGRLRAEKADLMERIAGGEWEDSTSKELDDAIKEFADDFGYDLDEEGQPLEDGGDSDRVRERAAASSDGDGEAEEGEGEGEAEAAEQEAATA
jgi:F-type H+-transporting ATPase subunit alpha